MPSGSLSNYQSVLDTARQGIDDLPPDYVQGTKQELVDVVLNLLINGL